MRNAFRLSEGLAQVEGSLGCATEKGGLCIAVRAHLEPNNMV
jgi:hypothetical protein